MLSIRPHIDQNAQRAHHKLPMRTPTKPAPSNTPGVSTILRTNLKENGSNRTAILKTAPRAHFIPSTPRLNKSVTASLATPAFNPLKESGLLGTAAKNTMKMPRLLDLTNKTPFASHHVAGSPGSGVGEPPLKAPFQLATVASADVPATILRPSRARTSLRMPRISDGSASNAPITPAPEGRRKHWEVLSDGGDISVGNISNDDLGQSSIDLEEEIEYMPPRAVELPYDPGFDMPDYKELGANIWKIGNIFDVSTLADTRPPDLPFVIEPNDIPSFDSVIQLEPYTPPEEDLETFIGSHNLYTRFEKPSNAPALPSLAPSTSTQHLKRSEGQSTKPKLSRANTSSQQPDAKSALVSGDIKRTRNSRAPSRSISVLASSIATIRPAAERTARQPTLHSTTRTPVEKPAVKASKASPARASRAPKGPAALPTSTRVMRSATAARRTARANPVAAMQPSVAVNQNDDIVPELMIPLDDVLGAFDLRLIED